MKTKFISMVRDIVSKDNKNIDIIISTHSPFLVTDASQEKVFIFQKDKNSVKTVLKRPWFQTLGSSVNKINIEVFGATNTIGDNALNKMDELIKLHYHKDNLEEFLVLLNSSLGDSVEKTILINRLNKQ